MTVLYPKTGLFATGRRRLPWAAVGRYLSVWPESTLSKLKWQLTLCEAEIKNDPRAHPGGLAVARRIGRMGGRPPNSRTTKLGRSRARHLSTIRPHPVAAIKL